MTTSVFVIIIFAIIFSFTASIAEYPFSLYSVPISIVYLFGFITFNTGGSSITFVTVFVVFPLTIALVSIFPDVFVTFTVNDTTFSFSTSTLQSILSPSTVPLSDMLSEVKPTAFIL